LNIVFQILREFKDIGEAYKYLTESEKLIIHDIIFSSLVNLHYGKYVSGKNTTKFAELSKNMPASVAAVLIDEPKFWVICLISGFLAIYIIGLPFFSVASYKDMAASISSKNIPAEYFYGFILFLTIMLLFASIPVAVKSIASLLYWHKSKVILNRGGQS
jgi:hypothetical protein